jgi:hypothetical protein
LEQPGDGFDMETSVDRHLEILAPSARFSR